MKKWIAVLFLAITAAGAQSQAVTAFISNGSGGWAAAVSSSATGAISIPPPAPYLYCQNQATATSFSITTDAVTVEATNSFAAGNRVYLAGWTAATYFNGQTATILSAGLSGSQYEFDFTHANVTSTNDTGTATMWVPATSACFSGGSGGTSVTVNGGSALTIANFNSTTPAAGSGYQNLPFQTSTTNVSVEAPYASSSMFGLAKVDNTTITASNGVISAVVPPPANFLASNFTTTSVSPTVVTTGLACPAVAAGTSKRLEFVVYWSQALSQNPISGGFDFAYNFSAAPTWAYGDFTSYTVNGFVAGQITADFVGAEYPTVTGPITPTIWAITPTPLLAGEDSTASSTVPWFYSSTANYVYKATGIVTVVAGANPVTVTLYTDTSVRAGDSTTIYAGSSCGFLP